MTYVLHYAPDNASLIVRLALEELDAPYMTRLVDRGARAQDSDAYRALNPAGMIPALETPDGVMFETCGILIWLADRHGAMAPAPDDPQRGNFLKWMLFTATSMQTVMRMTFYPEKFVGPDETARQALLARLTGPEGLPRSLSILDAAYAGWDRSEHPWMLDYYVATILRWCALYGAAESGWFDLAQYPRLAAMAQSIETRPAVARAALAEGLGPTPFSAPHPANPPEGRAL